jgi:hypothetical protein
MGNTTPQLTTGKITFCNFCNILLIFLGSLSTGTAAELRELDLLSATIGSALRKSDICWRGKYLILLF